ncbi:MAG: hypothetical protein EBZ34_05600 [Flavobacteriia bacterium]|nr:hypothetical protein [Flavobacteriia bacterium]
MQEKRIAVARFSALGDVLLLWPVLEAVAAAYPGYKLTLFTRPAFLPHLPEHPGIQKVGLDIDGSHAGLGAQFFFGGAGSEAPTRRFGSTHTPT